MVKIIMPKYDVNLYALENNNKVCHHVNDCVYDFPQSLSSAFRAFEVEDGWYDDYGRCTAKVIREVVIPTKDMNIEELCKGKLLNLPRDKFAVNVHETERGFIINHKGKYMSNMSLVLNTKQHIPTWLPKRNPSPVLDNMGIYWDAEGEADYIHGRYFISRKGMSCFEIIPDISKAPDIMVRIKWGGGHGNSTRGLSELVGGNVKGMLYFHKADSNGGAYGFSYLVVPKNWKRIVSVDDMDYSGERLTFKHVEEV